MTQQFLITLKLPTVRTDGTPLAPSEIQKITLSRAAVNIGTWLAPFSGDPIMLWDTPPAPLAIFTSAQLAAFYQAQATDTQGFISQMAVGASPLVLAAPGAPTLQVELRIS